MAPNSTPYERTLVLALRSPHGGKTTYEVSQILGIDIRKVNRIYARAISRGFNPDLPTLVVKPEFVEDAARSGRPSKQTEAIDKVVSSNVTRDRYEEGEEMY